MITDRYDPDGNEWEPLDWDCCDMENDFEEAG